MTERKEDQNQQLSEVETFSVPFPLSETQKYITINTYSLTKASIEQLLNKAIKYHSDGNYSKASELYQYLITRGCNNSTLFSNYAIILNQKGDIKKAKELNQKSINLFPDSAQAYINLGNIYVANNNLYEAEKLLIKAIKLDPSSAIGHANLASILLKLRKLKEAEIIVRKAIRLDPCLELSYLNLGVILMNLGELDRAEKATRKAIDLNPSFTKAYSNLGNILREMGKLNEAILVTRKAINFDPDFADAYLNMAYIYKLSGKIKDAIYYYKKALEKNINLSKAKAGLIECKAQICDWTETEIQNDWLKNLGIEGDSVEPMTLMYSQDDPLKQLNISKNFFNRNYYSTRKNIHSKIKEKIRIGYFSSDFYNHATMYLMIRVFELHNKSEFEIFIYDYGYDLEDDMTLRLKESVSFYRNIKHVNDKEAIDIARNDELNIAIDLKGYSNQSRIGIFSQKVAPIQISYLGYPGSLGTDAIDFIIADKILIPKEYECFYSEKIIIMPDCYQCNDDTKEICKNPISREEFKLPKEGFVFTCFNSNKKITQREFNIWMRLLLEIEGSVLWLYKSNQWSVENLYKEALKNNISLKRLVFAEKLPLSKHLARHALGDLALDTFNYNGHTTTSDALWAGLPVLTKIGKSFAARVSASQLTSMGLNELITYNEKDYEETAIRLAKNKNQLLNLKEKLLKRRDSSPLFNSKLYTKNLEDKFKEILRVK